MIRLLIDCDPGIDDALALLYAWASPEVDVAAITTVAGNVPSALGAANVQRLVERVALRRTPLLGQGSDVPLAAPAAPLTPSHGRDGLGNLELPSSQQPLPVRDGLGVLHDGIRAGAFDRIAALGPLTNLARLLAQAPELVPQWPPVVIMGGDDFNFAADPEAARQVLEAPLQRTLVTLEATRQVVFPREELERLARSINHPVSCWIAHWAQFMTERNRPQLAGSGAYFHDLAAMAYVVDLGVGGSEASRMTVDAHGRLVRREQAPVSTWVNTMDATAIRREVKERLPRLLSPSSEQALS